MTLDNLIGIVAGILTTIGVLPQIIKAIRTKKVEDVSPSMFVLLCLGVGLWTVYGIMKNDWPIIITNSISFTLNGMMLYIILTQTKD